MNSLIYAGQGNIASRRLLNSISHQIDSQRWTHFDNLKSLTVDLHNPMGQRLIAILFPQNRKELTKLVSLRHLLQDMQIVLILPNTHPQTISDGHILRPRYISYADSDFSDVAAVCVKMIARHTYHFLETVH